MPSAGFIQAVKEFHFLYKPGIAESFELITGCGKGCLLYNAVDGDAQNLVL